MLSESGYRIIAINVVSCRQFVAAVLNPYGVSSITGHLQILSSLFSPEIKHSEEILFQTFSKLTQLNFIQEESTTQLMRYICSLTKVGLKLPDFILLQIKTSAIIGHKLLL